MSSNFFQFRNSSVLFGWLGIVVFSAIIATAKAGLQADPGQNESASQILTAPPLAWGNDDDPDEGGQWA
ncbi:hypothetical protein QLH52_05850 [Methylomonas sp. OY6]|uniref:Uncharacterized protein n=1 Tax=Methylomonas defluvii TaxID=3045149 RepID=A0ABU4UBG5_9GAMM|nr:hypothetical protein [Methylomonas sp. OY6]MDX8126796.1 hypothetical protein [Methylomonas sp. OY6]